MTVNSRDFLSSAESILGSAVSESCYRSAISRAYYASYHRAIENYEAPEYLGGGMHNSYIQSLQKAAPNSIERRLGMTLRYIYDLRIISDYHPELEINKNQSNMILACAKKNVFEMLQSN